MKIAGRLAPPTAPPESIEQAAFVRLGTGGTASAGAFVASRCSAAGSPCSRPAPILGIMELDPTEAEALRYARSGDLRQEVDSLVQPLIDQGVTPGAVVGVLLPDGGTRFFSYGVRERDGGGKPERDTLFAIGSLSKGFLGAITASLVQEGRLSWDDTLEKLLPPNTPLSPDAKKITLQQLATHTSGLPRQPMSSAVFTRFLGYLFTGESFYSPLDRAYMLEYLSTFVAPRTVEFEYSNVGFGILGDVVAQSAGLTVDELLEQTIVKPLGLKNTGYAPETLPGYAMRARGYAGDQPKFIRRGRPVPDWRFTELMRGSAALYSTAEDLLTFAAASLQGRETPISAAMADTLQIRLRRTKESAAVAWTVDDIAGERITHQLGIVAGYTGYLGLDVAHRTAVVVLQNTFNWNESIGSRLLVRMGRAQDQWARDENQLRHAQLAPPTRRD
jgi:CubicO group peptidase (beta-lactamase class C family)